MIKYAGKYFICPTQEASDWIKKYINMEEMWPLDFQTRNHNLHHLGPKDPPMPESIQLGELHWPTCAQGVGHIHLLATEDIVGALRNRTDSAVDSLIMTDSDDLPNSLSMTSDGLRLGIQPTMAMLPPRPLQDIPGFDKFWLCTFVDNRYFWWQTSNTLDVVEGTETWVSFFVRIAEVLGITLSVGTIHPAYGIGPTRRFSVNSNQPLPVLLDALADACGCRFVTGIDGTYKIQNYAQSVSLSDTKNHKSRKMAGGDAESKARFVPQAIRVCFSKRSCGDVYYTEPYIITVYLNATMGQVEAFPAYVEKPPSLKDYVATGTGAKSVVADMDAILTTPDSLVPSNYAELLLYAQELARNEYRWMCSFQDLSYAGMIRYRLGGQDELAVWRYTKEMCSTRVIRSTYNDRALGSFRVSGEEGYLSAYMSPRDYSVAWDQPNSGPCVRKTVILPVSIECDSSGQTVTYEEFYVPRGFESTGIKTSTTNMDCNGGRTLIDLCVTRCNSGGGSTAPGGTSGSTACRAPTSFVVTVDTPLTGSVDVTVAYVGSDVWTGNAKVTIEGEVHDIEVTLFCTGAAQAFSVQVSVTEIDGGLLSQYGGVIILATSGTGSADLNEVIGSTGDGTITANGAPASGSGGSDGACDGAIMSITAKWQMPGGAIVCEEVTDCDNDFCTSGSDITTPCCHTMLPAQLEWSIAGVFGTCGDADVPPVDSPNDCFWTDMNGYYRTVIGYEVAELGWCVYWPVAGANQHNYSFSLPCSENADAFNTGGPLGPGVGFTVPTLNQKLSFYGGAARFGLCLSVAGVIAVAGVSGWTITLSISWLMIRHPGDTGETFAGSYVATWENFQTYSGPFVGGNPPCAQFPADFTFVSEQNFLGNNGVSPPQGLPSTIRVSPY